MTIAPRRDFVWVPRDHVKHQVLRGMSPAQPVLMKDEPCRVWTPIGLVHDASHKPAMIDPIQWRTTLQEDRSHDWQWCNGVFRFFSHNVTGGNLWVLVQWGEGEMPDVTPPNFCSRCGAPWKPGHTCC